LGQSGIAAGRTDLPAMTPHAIARLLEQTARAVYRAPERSVLHPGQWAVLRYLTSAGPLARTVNGVARYLETTHGTASRAVQALETKGLVGRAPHPDDGRSHIIDVTTSGLEILRNDPVSVLADAIALMPDDVRIVFVEGLQHAYEHVKSTGPSQDDGTAHDATNSVAHSAAIKKGLTLANILIVEDDAPIAAAFARTLQDNGYDVQVCDSAEAAQTTLAAQSFDLMLLDLWLPNMSGLDFLKSLNANTDRIKVITISGGGPGRSLENALTISEIHGVEAALVKPVTSDELLSAIANALKS